MSEETKVSNETVVDSGTENVTQETAQNEYIAESKKYRKRAQDAESKLADLEKKLESQENAKLKEKEEFKTLAEKYEAQVNDLNPYKEKYEGLVEQRKTALLEKLPEEDRDNFKNKDLDVLEFMVSKLETKTPTEPQARATVKGSKPVENWASLKPEERRSRWGEILQNFNKK
jgi:vancomycin resistance protein YoaR